MTELEAGYFRCPFCPEVHHHTEPCEEVGTLDFGTYDAVVNGDYP